MGQKNKIPLSHLKMYSTGHSSLLDSVEVTQNLRKLFSVLKELRFLFESTCEIHHLPKGAKREKTKSKTTSTLRFDMKRIQTLPFNSW